MNVNSVRESTSTLTKQDILKMIRLYGFDKKRFENLIMINEPSQQFVISTEHGDIIVDIEYEVKEITIDAPDRVKEQF